MMSSIILYWVPVVKGVIQCFIYVFQGLECSASHWPCLDKVITVLYALYNYEGRFIW